MSDLVAARYPVTNPDWLADGSPLPPYRSTIPRWAVNGSTAIATTQLNVYAVEVQPGDIFSTVSFLVKTAAATLTHSWVAVYNGVGTGAALLAQSTDNTTATGWATGKQNIALASVVANVGSVGTPQGPSTAATVNSGATVWGIAVYQSGTTGDTLDGNTGTASSVGGMVAITGQVPLFSTGTLAATATAPAVLPTMTAASGAIPYLLLSR